MKTKTTRAAALALSLAATAAAPAAAIDPGHAEAELVLAGQSIPLRHAYALERDNTEGMMAGPELRILLTDAPVPEAHRWLAEVVPGFGPIGDLAREGRIRGALIVVDPAKPGEAAYVTQLVERPPNESFLTMTHRPAPFERFAVAQNRVTGAGDLQMMRGSFDAPLFRAPPVIRHLAGREAVESPPAQALLAAEAALRSGDLARARTLVSARKWAEIERVLDHVGRAEFMKQAAQYLPDPAVRAAQIREVVLRAATAYLILDTGDGGRTGMGMSRDGERWLWGD